MERSRQVKRFHGTCHDSICIGADRGKAVRSVLYLLICDIHGIRIISACKASLIEMTLLPPDKGESEANHPLQDLRWLFC